MFNIVSLLFVCISVRICTSISSSTIENDLDGLVKLHKEFLDRSPSIPAYKAYEVRCRAVATCCPNEQENLFSLFTESQFNEKCLSNGTKISTASVSSACMTTLRQLVQITKESIYQQYFQVLGNSSYRLHRIQIWKKQMQIVCSKDELNAYYCQRNNLDKFKSCQRKVLEMVANENIEDDGTIYKTYVSQWEQEYAIDNHKLRKAFPKP